jgi:hypothetical protein
MREFLLTAALTLSLAAGAVTVFAVQFTLAAAQTFTIGVGFLAR